MNARKTLIAAVGAVAILTTGCASNGNYMPYQPIPAGSVMVMNQANEPFDVADADTKGKLAAQDAAGGALLGAGYGAVYGAAAGFACGPLFIVCSPAIAIVGAGTGIVVGGVGGTVSGATRGIEKDEAEAFEAMVRSSLENNDPSDRLGAHFAAQSGELWTFSESGPGIGLELRFESLELDQNTDQTIALTVSTSITLQYGSTQKERTRSFLFRHRSRMIHIDEWMADDGAAFDQLLEDAYRETTTEMVAAFAP
jgi:hypothetical protein